MLLLAAMMTAGGASARDLSITSAPPQTMTGNVLQRTSRAEREHAGEPVVKARPIPRARMAAGETLNFRCVVTTSDKPGRRPGIYDLTYKDGRCTFTLVKEGEELACIDGAAAWTPDGYFLTRSESTGLYRWTGDIRLYRTSDWSLVRERKNVKQYEFFYSGAWDYARNRLFLPFDQDSLVGGRLAGHIDVPDLTTHVPRDRGFWLPGYTGTGGSTPQTWAINTDGNIYFITYDGNFYRSSGVTNTQVKVGNTGLGNIVSCGSYIDPETHYYYVFAYGISSNKEVDGLYRIDLRTARTELLWKSDERIGVEGLYMPGRKLAHDAAPAAVTDLKWTSASTGALNGKISFTVPAVNYNGSTAAGQVSYAVVVDCDTVRTGTTAYGANVEIDHTFADTNFHNIRVSLSNSAGASPYAAIDPFVGRDGPKKIEQPKLTYADGKLKLNWKAPTESAHGGDWTPSTLNYTVTRMPEGVKVADKISATTFEEAMAEPDYARGVYYTVSANSDGVTGTGILSDTVYMGHTTIPYDYDFSDKIKNAGFAIHNGYNHHRQQGWRSNAGNKSMIYYYGAENGNAWFISPSFHMEKGKAYRVDYELSGTKDGYQEQMEVKAGYGNRPGNMTIPVMDTTVIDSKREDKANHPRFYRYIVPTRTGDINIGFHCVSRYALYYVYAYRLQVAEPLDAGAPFEASDMEFVPTDKSLPKGELHFKAPVKDFSGNSLSGNMTVKVWRDSVLVSTLENVAPGSAQTVADQADRKAQYTYRIVAFNSRGEGAETRLKAFVGANIPAAPKVLTAYEGETEGTVTVKWEAPALDKDKNPINPNIITYQILTSDQKTILADDVKGNEATVRIQDPGQPGTWVYVRVKAKTAAGVGSAASSYYCYIGKRETLPFSEPIEGGVDLNYLWRSETLGNVSWGNLVDFQADQKPSQNGDNGYWGLNMGGLDYAGRKLSPKITVTGENPTLSFWIYCKPENTNTFDVLVNEQGGYSHWSDAPVATFNFDEPREGWYRRTVSLAPWKGKTIQFGFMITCKRFSLAMIDHIGIDDPKPIDLEAGRFNIDKTLKTDSTFHAVFPFINIGTKPSGACKVELSRNGNVFLTRDFENLLPGAMDSVVYNENVTVGFTRGNRYQARILSDADADTTNNLSRILYSEVPMPDLARIFTLTGRESDDKKGAELSWQAANLNIAAADTTDDLEKFVPFSTGMAGSAVEGDNTGDWIFIDRDGKKPRTLTISNKTVTFPNCDKPFGFIVWNHEKAGVTATAWKGNNKSRQGFMSLGFDGGRKDDWLISPAMPDCAPDVSLWLRTNDSKSPKEVIELWVSKGSTNPDDFVKDDTFTVPYAWGRMSFTMPTGYTRFALRVVTENGSSLLIDDITYTVNDDRYKSLNLKGYNVYRNGIKLNSALINTTAYTDLTPDRSVGNAYTVTSVFDRGEAGSGNAWVLDPTSGAGAIDADASAVRVYTSGRTIVVEGAAGKTVSIFRPDGTWLTRLRASERMTFSAESAGIYIVRAGDRSYKTAVR